MKRHKSILIAMALFVAGVAGASSSGFAQSFQSYHCADGTQFIAGFYQYDKRAHLQIDGREVTLAKRFSLTGSRYSGGGVTLKIGKTGTTVKHAKRPTTACELT